MINYIDDTVKRYPCLKECEKEMRQLVSAICTMYKTGGKLLLCGNGGSAADCEHISGELLKGFLLPRKPDEKQYGAETEIIAKLQKGIPAIPLTSFTSSLSAFANDEHADLSFAQLVFALGKKEDVFLGISTSGNSKNVVAAAKTAKVLGMKTVALTGAEGGELSEICDIAVKVPESETYKIQEIHLPVYHAVCAQCEWEVFGKIKKID